MTTRSGAPSTGDRRRRSTWSGCWPRRAPSLPVLVDCLSTWLARVMDDCGVWSGAAGRRPGLAARVDRLVAAWQAARRPVVAVSNEVGSGVVPAHRLRGRTGTSSGMLNARIAAGSSEVWLCTAGIAQRLR